MKEIPLTRNKVALVDDEDYEKLSQHKWHCMKFRNKYYARRCDGHNKKIYMHREIAGFPEGKIVDHRNGNGLDNQRHNLRNCTQHENGMNKSLTVSESSSPFKGVTIRNNKFIARITYNGEQIFIGRFEKGIDAAIAYDKRATELFGEFAKTNFPF